MLPVTVKLRGALVDPSATELLQETAREEGFRSMLERGRSKVAAGLTTPEELVRVLAP